MVTLEQVKGWARAAAAPFLALAGLAAAVWLGRRVQAGAQARGAAVETREVLEANRAAVGEQLDQAREQHQAAVAQAEAVVERVEQARESVAQVQEQAGRLSAEEQVARWNARRRS